MIADLKPYPSYKESGLEWVGNIPDHWNLLPNRIIMRYRKKLVGERHNDYTLLSLTKRGVIVRDLSEGKGKFSADMGTSQEVCEGDLVFCLFDVPETPRTVGQSAFNGMITGAYTVFQCDDPLLAQYIELFYKAMDDQKLLRPLYSGLRNTIPKDRFLGTKTPVPSLPEQKAIVRYLDYMDLRIRKYIATKEKLIKLLEEQKRAVVHQAVTRGLDPDIPLKPSGVEWLGDVPDHWEIRQLGRFGKFSKGNGGTKDDEVKEGVSCIRYGDLYMHHEYYIKESHLFVKQDRVLAYTPIQFGDLLFAGSGETIEEIGKSAVNLIANEVCCGGDIILFRSTIEIDAQYLGYAADSPQSIYQKSCMGRGITVMHIYGNQLKYMWIALPPVNEQKKITLYLGKKLKAIKSAINQAGSQIEFIQEFHIRLIADVVTGKLDVREAAAKLPKELLMEDKFDEIRINDSMIKNELDTGLEDIST